MRAFGVLELIRTGRVALPRTTARLADDRPTTKPRAA